MSTQLTFDIGAASLGIGVFSGTVDLLHVCSTAYRVWRDIRDVDIHLQSLRARLVLQQSLLDQWQRDWYGFTVGDRSSVQRLRLLKHHDETVRNSVEAIKNLLLSLQGLQTIAAHNHGGSTTDRLQWLAQRDSGLESVDTIEKLLLGLYRLLPPRIPNSEAILVLSLDDAEHAAPNSARSTVASRTIALRKLELSLATDLKLRVTENRMTLPQPNLRIPATQIQIRDQGSELAGSQVLGILDGHTPVMIEWKKYDPSWQGQKGVQLRGRIDNLARLLHTDSKPDELLTLSCRGYYDDTEHGRYGFVFSLPAHISSSEIELVSLKQLLDKPSAARLPALEDRYQIAYALALSIALLHTTGWLHKSLRSHNVLFSAVADKPLWPRPYLVGFEFSRPDEPDQSSEKGEVSARFDIYRHPQTRGSPRESFRKAFDWYSLGVVLLEIGMWRAAWRWWKDGLDMPAFRNELIELASTKLAHFMGVEYRDAVLKCLTGELENRDGPILDSFFVEVVEVLGRLVA